MSDAYDEDYFMRGKESGKSLYHDYRWLPDLTIPMVKRMIDHLGIRKDQTILDFGCARGYTVKAFRQLGYLAFGVDSSKWAIENCDPEVKEYVWEGSITERIDWVIAKDVLEHVKPVQSTIKQLMQCARIGVFAVVPLEGPRGKYVVPDYELDITHIHRKQLKWWAAYFMDVGWSVTASYRVRGIKDNYYQPDWVKGNGFITARRIYE